jgi:hypothetical protein
VDSIPELILDCRIKQRLHNIGFGDYIIMVTKMGPRQNVILKQAALGIFGNGWHGLRLGKDFMQVSGRHHFGNVGRCS